VAEPQGYKSTAYRQALSGLGRAVAFGSGHGFLIARPIAATGFEDLIGPYPFLSTDEWPAVLDALGAFSGPFVALSFVADPFCPLALNDFRARFDVARVLNEQYIVDLREAQSPSRHHRKKLRSARSGLTMALRAPEAEDAAKFEGLYATLVGRKLIRDFRAFDGEALRAQVQVPGAMIVEARIDDALAGMDLYYLDGDHAHAHLSAYSEVGYAQSVSYPMMAYAIAELAAYAKKLNLGGAPSMGGDGIRHFKSGWTTTTRPSFLCGRVLDRVAYRSLVGGPLDPSEYFPAYRLGEFTRRD
jgi:hypothetical protein